uniref:Uncharacterized protein n=1 Tax=Seriola lalandi dorsalis TaxID=1841481 RepID=A0A3B4X3G5_SERLL
FKTNQHYLRKQARQLENELDLKLVSFSKLCTSYSSSSNWDQQKRDIRSTAHFSLHFISTHLAQMKLLRFSKSLIPN